MAIFGVFPFIFTIPNQADTPSNATIQSLLPFNSLICSSPSISTFSQAHFLILEQQITTSVRNPRKRFTSRKKVRSRILTFLICSDGRRRSKRKQTLNSYIVSQALHKSYGRVGKHVG